MPLANTVETLYNTINFCWSTHKRHSIARPKGRGMGCLLWVQRATYYKLIDIELYEIFAIINRAIKGLHCMPFSHHNSNSMEIFISLDFHSRLWYSYKFLHMTQQHNCHNIWIVMEKLFVKRPLKKWWSEAMTSYGVIWPQWIVWQLHHIQCNDFVSSFHNWGCHNTVPVK